MKPAHFPRCNDSGASRKDEDFFVFQERISVLDELVGRLIRVGC